MKQLCTLLLASVALCTAGPIALNPRSNPGDGCTVPGTSEENLGLYAPHPSNCSQFLVCDNGIFREMDCSPGLHWNALDQACDWPSNANCSNDGSNPTPTIPPSEIPPITSTPTSTTTSIPTTEPPTVEPSTEPPTVEPSTESSTVDSSTEPPTVEPSTEPQVNTTETETETTIVTETPTTSGPPTGPPTVTDTTSGETTWSPPTTPEGGWTSCPAVDPLEYTIHIPHPNCSLYYVCDNGVARERPCPAGLHWNAKEWTCDWPRSANCVENAAPEIPGAIPLPTQNN